MTHFPYKLGTKPFDVNVSVLCTVCVLAVFALRTIYLGDKSPP